MRKKSTFRDWVPLWVIPVLAIFAVGTVWIRLRIVRTTYAIHQAEGEIHALQQLQEQTELKLAALRSPRRLELLARTQFNLSRPRADQIVHLSALPRKGKNGNGI